MRVTWNGRHIVDRFPKVSWPADGRMWSHRWSGVACADVFRLQIQANSMHAHWIPFYSEPTPYQAGAYVDSIRPFVVCAAANMHAQCLGLSLAATFHQEN